MAQSFFEALFGAKPAPVARPLPPPAPLALPVFPGNRRSGPIELAPHETLSRSSRGQPTSLDDTFEPHWRARAGEPDDGGSASYATVCVRICDGFYWPLHHATRRRDFPRAARQCESSCGEDAKLFYMPNKGAGGIETAVDLQGRPYSKLPTALFYRKTLINGCACRPSPWSSSEAARHAEYLAIEQEARLAVQAALAADTAAPMGSFRAAQEIGKPKPAAPRMLVSRRRDAPDDVDTASFAAPDTGADRLAGIAQPRRPRPSRVAKADADVERPRPAPRTDTKPQRQLAATPYAAPAPGGFKPFAGLGGSQFKWPGD